MSLRIGSKRNCENDAESDCEVGKFICKHDRNHDYSRHNANDDPPRLVRMPVLHLGDREYLIVSDRLRPFPLLPLEREVQVSPAHDVAQQSMPVLQIHLHQRTGWQTGDLLSRRRFAGGLLSAELDRW